VYSVSSYVSRSFLYVYMYIYACVSYDTVNPVCVYTCLISTLTVYVWQPLAARTYSLAWGNVIPVKDGERVSVYISQPVPCR